MNFFRGWEAYRDGFGTLTGEHWLGEGPAACRLGGAGGRLVPDGWLSASPWPGHAEPARGCCVRGGDVRALRGNEVAGQAGAGIVGTG